MVPVASWVSVWSIRMAISSPAVSDPSTLWAANIFCVRFMGMGAVSQGMVAWRGKRPGQSVHGDVPAMNPLY